MKYRSIFHVHNFLKVLRDQKTSWIWRWFIVILQIMWLPLQFNVLCFKSLTLKCYHHSCICCRQLFTKFELPLLFYCRVKHDNADEQQYVDVVTFTFGLTLVQNLKFVQSFVLTFPCSVQLSSVLHQLFMAQFPIPSVLDSLHVFVLVLDAVMGQADVLLQYVTIMLLLSSIFLHLFGYIVWLHWFICCEVCSAVWLVFNECLGTLLYQLWK